MQIVTVNHHRRTFAAHRKNYYIADGSPTMLEAGNSSERYSRQIETLGEGGQKKLRNSTVTIVGLGGLGSPVSAYLAVAGIGHLRIVDHDRVRVPDLNRQILYGDRDVGKMKSTAAEKGLRELNEEINVEQYNEKVSEKNVSDLIDGSEVVIDCLDNWESRFILNRACVEMRIPLVHGAVENMNGQLTTIVPKETPCLSCIFREQRGEARVSIVGFAPGVIGSIQVGEAIKLLAGIGETLKNKLLIVDLRNCSFDTIRISRDDRCGVCGD